MDRFKKQIVSHSYMSLGTEPIDERFNSHKRVLKDFFRNQLESLIESNNIRPPPFVNESTFNQDNTTNRLSEIQRAISYPHMLLNAIINNNVFDSDETKRMMHNWKTVVVGELMLILSEP